MGLIEKQWQIDDAHQTLTLSYKLHWEEVVIGSLRLGHVTLFPERFDAANLVFKTHNGGRHLESFELGNMNIDHGEAVSFLISGKQAFGMTEGYAEISDQNTGLGIQINSGKAAPVCLITNKSVDDKYFSRITLSIKEIDDTSRASQISKNKIEVKIFLINKLFV
jgi:hypothetical protein